MVATETDEIGGIGTTVEGMVASDVAEIVDATVAAVAEVAAENDGVVVHVPDLDPVQETESHDQDHQETAVAIVMVDEAAVVVMVIRTIVMVVVVTDVIVATTIRAVDLDAEEETVGTDVEEEMAVTKMLSKMTVRTTKMKVTTLKTTVTKAINSMMLSVMVVEMTTAHLETEAWSVRTTLLRKANAIKTRAAQRLQRITLDLEMWLMVVTPAETMVQTTPLKPRTNLSLGLRRLLKSPRKPLQKIKTDEVCIEIHTTKTQKQQQDPKKGKEQRSFIHVQMCFLLIFITNIPSFHY